MFAICVPIGSLSSPDDKSAESLVSSAWGERTMVLVMSDTFSRNVDFGVDNRRWIDWDVPSMPKYSGSLLCFLPSIVDYASSFLALTIIIIIITHLLLPLTFN